MNHLPFATPRLLVRQPSRAMAEAMGAAATCPYGPCMALPPMWLSIARALSGDLPGGMVPTLAGAAGHAARSCHLHCPASGALRDIVALHEGTSDGAEAAEASSAA